MPAPRLIDRRAYVVDDEAPLRSIIRRILTGSGIYTEEFDSAEAFLSGIETRPLGCILLDVQLPGMSGLEMLEKLSSDGIRHPVIMISGQGDIPSAVGAVKKGALDFIEKPFRKEQLLELVESAFRLVQKMEESGPNPNGSLSKREVEVLKCLVNGESNKVVARQLGISSRTVEVHRANLFKKLGADNLTQALSIAKESGLLA